MEHINAVLQIAFASHRHCIADRGWLLVRCLFYARALNVCSEMVSRDASHLQHHRRAEHMLIISEAQILGFSDHGGRLMAKYRANMATHSSLLGSTRLLTWTGSLACWDSAASPNYHRMLLTSPCWVHGVWASIHIWFHTNLQWMWSVINWSLAGLVYTH